MTKIQKIIEYGLYALVFLLPIQTRWIIKAGEINGGYSEYGTISLYGTDILLSVLLSLFVVYKLCQRQQVTSYKLQVTRIWWMIAGLELFIFISIFFAPDKVLAVYKYGVFLLGVGLFWLVVSAYYDRLKLAYAFLGGVMFQAGLGIWQFFSQSSFASKWLGLAAHDPAELGTSVVETLDGGRWLRAYGGLDHPNVLGGLVVIGILLILIILTRNKILSNKNAEIGQSGNPKSPAGTSGPLRDWEIGRGEIIFLFSVCCFPLAALFFTFSRGAWAGLIVGLLVMLILAVIKKDLQAQKRILKFVLSGSILIFILFNIYGDLVLTRLSQDTRLEVKSNTERMESYHTAWGLIKENWLLGAGMGNYTHEIRNWEIEKLGAGGAEPSWYYQPVHNTFLLIWAEIGIFGLLFFSAFLLFTFYFLLNGWRNRENGDFMRPGIFAAIIVMMMVDHWWWSLHFGVLLFWLMAGLMLYSEQTDEK